MASKKDPYEVVTTLYLGKAQKMLRKGWEMVSATNKPPYTLRRPNPKYKGDK